MEITVAQCIELIVEFCSDNRENINKEFSEKIPDEVFEKLSVPGNWHRESEHISDSTIMIFFICTPLDGQWRARTIIDTANAKLLAVSVQRMQPVLINRIYQNKDNSK